MFDGLYHLIVKICELQWVLYKVECEVDQQEPMSNF